MLWVQSPTKNYIRAEHKLHSISKLFILQVTIPQVMFACFCLAYLYSAGTQHGNLHSARWPILFCGPTQEPVLAAANTGKTWERFSKNAGEWTWRVEIRKEEIPGSKSSRHAINTPTAGFKGITFKLRVLNRWDLNFCIRSSPLRDSNSLRLTVSEYVPVAYCCQMIVTVIYCKWVLPWVTVCDCSRCMCV